MDETQREETYKFMDAPIPSLFSPSLSHPEEQYYQDD
jgi:hypothetical protein